MAERVKETCKIKFTDLVAFFKYFSFLFCPLQYHFFAFATTKFCAFYSMRLTVPYSHSSSAQCFRLDKIRIKYKSSSVVYIVHYGQSFCPNIIKRMMCTFRLTRRNACVCVCAQRASNVIIL